MQPSIPSLKVSNPWHDDRANVDANHSSRLRQRALPGMVFVALSTYSTNLVPGDINGTRDIFVRERLCRYEYFFPFILAAD